METDSLSLSCKRCLAGPEVQSAYHGCSVDSGAVGKRNGGMNMGKQPTNVHSELFTGGRKRTAPPLKLLSFT